MEIWKIHTLANANKFDLLKVQHVHIFLNLFIVTFNICERS